MALKQREEKPATAAEVAQTLQALPQSVPTLTLTLNMYKNYSRNGVQYKAGVQYKFKRDSAMVLLEETDAGRPVWKIWRAPVVRKATATQVDQSAVEIQPIVESDPVVADAVAAKKIEIGGEDEIEDLLSRPDDVTV
jgi:hypothetical protein